jgi:putative hemolysin
MTTSGSRALLAALRSVPTEERHIIDQLIQERAENLLGRPLLGALGRSVLYPLLGYRDAVRVADTMASLRGFAAMGFLSRELQLDVQVENAEVLPAGGAAMIVGNHPTGIADGVVVFDTLAARRPDFTMFANRDAIRVAPTLADLIIPVEWVADRRSRARTRETLAETQRAFRSERLVVMFPSGRLAYMDDGRLRERPWMATAVSLARRHGIPVIPMHIAGRNSDLFYLFSRVSEQLRDITLFHEVLNKRGTTYRVRFGAPIAPEALDGDAEAVTARLQAHVESRFEVPFA